MIQTTLFVYGSLCEGMVHFNKIANFITKSEAAKANGSLYSLESGFPVYLQTGSTEIEGYLLTIEAPETLFLLLDQFYGFNAKASEKSLHFKAEIAVKNAEGATVTALAYTLNPAKLPKNATLVADGNWRRLLTEQEPLTNKLSDAQKKYIQQLGNASGRDIIPYKLDLCRDLMNKGLIVDKGRRLALSSLGKEVLRYID